MERTMKTHLSKAQPDVELFLSDVRGQYIPRDFAKCFADRNKVEGVTAEQWLVLEAGPDHEHYWDVWAEVLDAAKITGSNGMQYTFMQDGDVYAIPVGMEWDDERGWYFWPKES